MRTISADEIERCGFTAVDTVLEHGPVHVTRDGVAQYVIIDEALYQEMVEDLREAERLRIEASLADVAAGRTRQVTAEELIKAHRLED